MSESFVPSLREYATRYQIDSRRLTPRQLLMHPGPVNRGVELSPEVIDSPQSLMTAQVESGLVVRMAILYELLTGSDRAEPDDRPRAGRPAADRTARVKPEADVSAEPGARWSAAAARRPTWSSAAHGCFDPREGLDEVRDLVVRGGEIAELAEPGADAPDGAEVVEADGLLALPAFVDPHVHFRVPGQEHKEDLETGTRAAAAGGYCAVIAMANTTPPVDSASVLGSVRERAEREASVPVGFVANVTRGMEGEELTEMAELRDAGRDRASPTTACRSAAPASCAARSSTSGSPAA